MPDGALRQGLSTAAIRGPTQRDPTVWILLGNRTGDDNQLSALAVALGWPFETKTLRYNSLRHFPFLRDERLLHLTGETRSTLLPPWPDLVIGLGYESLPAARFIRRQSRGHTRVIQIGNPRCAIDDIDLVIATPQYPLPDATNLLKIPLPIGNPARAVTVTQEEEDWLQSMPRPRRLVAVGGSTRQWKVDERQLNLAIRHLKEARARSGGSVIAVTSRRTPPEIKRSLEDQLTGDAEACVHDFPRFATLLARCDEFHVTADSVSMLSEAILTGKPVGMIPIRRSLRGQVGHFLRRLGIPLQARADLSGFWRYLTENGLVGTVELPVASTVPDTTQVAVEAVRDILKRPRTPRIWALLGARKGDNNQVLALAEALGLPFVCKQLTYNHWRHLGPHLLGATLRSLTPGSRALLSGDLPDLTISTGHRSVAVVQSLRRRSGGRTRSIHVGYPRISPDKFDLVIATPEYPIREHPNLIRIPIALSRGTRRAEHHEDFWQSYPAPRRLLILGGPTLYWRLSPQTVGRALDDLLAKAKAHGGSVVVIGSPRTPRRLLLKAQERVRSVQVPATLVPVGGSPPYAELLEWADTISVTADSVAMVSDAISTGKPVELVPIQPTGAGWAVMALMDRVRPSEHAPPHDLRAFWRALKERGLVGSASKGVEPVPDLTCSAVSRAKAIVGGSGKSRSMKGPPRSLGKGLP